MMGGVMRFQLQVVPVMTAALLAACATDPRTEAIATWTPQPGTVGTPLVSPVVEAEFVPEPLGKKALHLKKLSEFGHTLEKVEQTRANLADKWKAAKTEEEKDGIRDEARAFVVSTIVSDIFPAWMGTPWTMYAVKDGLKPTALYPHEEGTPTRRDGDGCRSSRGR